MTSAEAVSQSPVLQQTFLDDVATVARSLEKTLRDIRLSTNSFPKLEDVLTQQLKPTALEHDLLDLNLFITLSGEYLQLVPLDVSVGLTDDAKARTRGPHEALRNQYVGNNLWGQRHWKQFYDDSVRLSIDATIARLEVNLNNFGTILARSAAEDLPGKTFIPVGGINSSYIGSLRVQAYRNAGLRLYEDPERMFTLSFRALAAKKGWLTRSADGTYSLAKNGKDLLSELQDVGLTEQLFEQYTGARIIIDSPPTAVRSPAFSDGIPVSDGSPFSPSGASVEFRLLSASTWTNGRDALQKACGRSIQQGRMSYHPMYVLDGQIINRPLTIKEDLRARLRDWNLGERCNDSCASITYGPNGLFKIVLISDTLLRLPVGSNQHYARIPYDSLIEDGVNVKEFNRARVISGRGLSRAEALNEEVWQFVAAEALIPYVAREWQDRDDDDSAMGIDLCSEPQVGETRALLVNCLYNSNLNASNSLYSWSAFARVVANRAR